MADVGTWFSLAGVQDKSLADELESRVQQHLASKDYTPADMSYISKMNLNLTSHTLSVSDENLEKLRRMCQLWDVSIKPQNITSHRKIVGHIIVAVKRLLFPILQVLLKDFIRQQRSFNAAAIDAIVNMGNSRGDENKRQK